MYVGEGAGMVMQQGTEYDGNVDVCLQMTEVKENVSSQYKELRLMREKITTNRKILRKISEDIEERKEASRVKIEQIKDLRGNLDSTQQELHERNKASELVLLFLMQKRKETKEARETFVATTKRNTELKEMIEGLKEERRDLLRLSRSTSDFVSLYLERNTQVNEQVKNFIAIKHAESKWQKEQIGLMNKTSILANLDLTNATGIASHLKALQFENEHLCHNNTASLSTINESIRSLENELSHLEERREQMKTNLRYLMDVICNQKSVYARTKETQSNLDNATIELCNKENSLMTEIEARKRNILRNSRQKSRSLLCWRKQEDAFSYELEAVSN